MSSPATTGQLVFDDLGLHLDCATLADAFCESPMAKDATIRYIGPNHYITLTKHVIQGQLFHITVQFENQKLHQVILVASSGKEGLTWADWTMQGEMDNKRLHEDWAQRVFGKRLDVMPYFTPNRVMPFEVKDETARYAQFEWGQVINSYDSKAGESCLVLKYGVHDPA